MNDLSMNRQVQQTLEAYKTIIAAQPGQGLLAPDVAKAWNIGSALQAYNLESLHSLFPQLTPIRNMTGRVKGKGKKVEYKAVTALNTASLNGWVAEGSAASTVTTTTIDKTATYKSFALADTVTFESQWAGEGFIDVKALAVTNLLRAAMIAEEQAILFGQVNGSANTTEQAPGAVGAAPNLTAASLTGAATGGSIAAGTYYGVETVVTGMGESTASAVERSVVVGGSGSGSIVWTPIAPAGQPVIGYNLYLGATGGPYYKVIAVDVSAGLPTKGSMPSNGATWSTNGQAITVTTLPANTQATPPVADATASANAFNGLYTQMWGGSGATLTAQNGALTIAALNTLLQTMWDSARADPDGIWCNSQESIKVTNLTLGAGTPYQVLVQQNDVAGATANFRVARFTNPATGSELPVKVHPTIPQGLMLALSNKLPGWYVPTDIPTVWEMDLPQDYVEIDYPPTSANPLWQVEVRFYGALKLYLPSIQGALYGISNA